MASGYSIQGVVLPDDRRNCCEITSSTPVLNTPQPEMTASIPACPPGTVPRRICPAGSSPRQPQSERQHAAGQRSPGQGADDTVNGDPEGLLETAHRRVGSGPEDPVHPQALIRVGGQVADLELLLDPAVVSSGMAITTAAWINWTTNAAISPSRNSASRSVSRRICWRRISDSSAAATNTRPARHDQCGRPDLVPGNQREQRNGQRVGERGERR
jgi:hypothetical protein